MKRGRILALILIVEGLIGWCSIPLIVAKIKDFKRSHPYIDIQVDGGLDEKVLLELKDLGIKDYVIGSAIYSDADPVEKYKYLKEVVPVHCLFMTIYSPFKI